MPRFSFLMPAFRTEEYIAASIESVLEQTSSDWELVVVDNGLSDEIAAITRAYADGRVRLLRQENRGYCGGVMAAASHARGEFLCVLDSDDLLTPQYVSVMSAAVDAHEPVDAIGCDAHQFVDGESCSFGRGYLHSTGSRPPARGGEWITVTDVLGGRVPYYTGAVRREVWNAVGGYSPGVAEIDESVLLWLRLARSYRALLLPDRLAHYRVREASLSRDPNRVEAFESSLVRTFELYAEESGNREHLGAAQKTIRRIKYHQALRRARWAFLDDDIRTARRFAREAYGQKRTIRAAAVVSSLAVAPHAMRSLYPLKQRITLASRRNRT